MNVNRREFIGLSMSAASGLMTGCAGLSRQPAFEVADGDLMWGALVHFGMNMWLDWQSPAYCGYGKDEVELRWPADHVRCEPALWREWTAAMARNRLNTIVIDLGEALAYPSHPELAVKGSLTPSQMRDELKRLRDLGLMTIPKMNFSCTHNAWMKGYRRMVSTPAYYRLCEDLIRDVCEIFDGPRYFHIGYDEETAEHQKAQSIAVVRQGELWWHDFLHVVSNVEKNGSRAWAFSDIAWRHMDEFRKNMPKSVLQCPWNFRADDQHPEYIESVREMVRLGYEIGPDLGTFTTKSRDAISEIETDNWYDFCRDEKNMPRNQLKGFLFCSWARPIAYHRQKNLKTFDLAGRMHDRWDREVGR